ncbi:MAG: DNA translocase FtsK [Planctomycetota bacterium]|jgi:S-DNA-T family DNA segregation ATPase FtsK/SpoIIIE
MIDISTLRRRAEDGLVAVRPTLISFAFAACGFIVAGIYLLTPGLAQGPHAPSFFGEIARSLAIAFGPSAIVLSLLAGAHGLSHLMGRGLVFDRARLLYSGALIVLLPCFLHLVGGAGGVIGLLAGDAISLLMPTWVAAVLTGLASLLVLVRSTDWLFYEALRQARQPRASIVVKPKPRRKAAKPKPAPILEEEDEEEEEDEDWEYEDEEEEEDDEDEWEEEEEDDEDEYEEEEEDGEEEEPEPEPTPVVVKRTPAKSKAKRAPLPAALPRPRKSKDTSPLPSYELLEQLSPVDLGRLERSIKKNAEILERTLASFRIETRVVGYTRGPVITMYELALKEGTKLSTVVNRSDDLAIALKAESVRIVAPIPGKNTVGVEVPNPIRDEVGLRALLEETSQRSLNSKAVPIFFGRDASGAPMVEDLAKMPHLLIAGATGSGKSVCINTLILSVLMTRRMDEVRLILVDPKQVELAFFKDIPHLLTGVVTDPRKAAQTLDWIVTEMEDRYRIFAMFGVRNITAYNALGPKRIRELATEHDVAEESAPDFMPYLVVVVDELADLIMTGKKDVEQAITRLAQKSRAVGIHSVLATQRPSTDVITGLIKANMPSRAAFKVTSKIDSRVVLDQSGAEKLLGMGDMLFLPPRSFHLVRAQGCYVSDDEVRGVVKYLKANGPGQELRELVIKHATLDERDPREVDDLFDTACRIVIEQSRGSASLLQRALSIGYTRASRLVDLMRGQGIIGEFKNAQAAEVLIDLEEYESKYGEPQL